MTFDLDEEIYLETLREYSDMLAINRFASRSDIEDKVDVANPRRQVNRAVFRAIKQTWQDHASRLHPILGSAGSGKTHAYWAFKDLELRMRRVRTQESVSDDFQFPIDTEIDWSIVYVPSPPAPIRILLHVYTCMIDEIGTDILDVVAKELVESWGGKKKKHLGLFGKADLDEVIQAGIRQYPGVFADCVKCLCIYELDKSRKALAERWLLGEDLDEEELDLLGINSVIEDDDICLAMIKLFTDHMKRVVVLYFDELESPYRTHGQEAEVRFLETLKRLYNEVKNVVIVAAILKEIWPRVLELADQALRSRMEPELELKPFTLADCKLYFAKVMETFWNENNLNPPGDPLFPLNDSVLETIYRKTNGNARDLIKLCRTFVDRIIEGEVTLEELAADTKTVATAQPPPKPRPAQVTTTLSAGTAGEPSRMDQRVQSMMDEEEYTIEANPPSVAGAALKCVKVFGDKHGKDYKVTLEFKFDLKRKGAVRTYTLAGLVEHAGKRVGLDVPAVKGFDRSGGVAATYAAERLANAITQGILTEAVLIVPEGTGGKKYITILQQNEGKIHVVTFNEETALELVRTATKVPNKDGWRIANLIFGDLPEPTEPEPSEGASGGDETGSPTNSTQPSA
ncbi:MAG: hypothetical protein Kow0069_18750 [Promethearchaeota archaeon]